MSTGAVLNGPGLQGDLQPGAQPADVSAAARPWFSAGALIGVAFALSPPLSSWVGRYAAFEATQYLLLAVLVPALVVLGAPWRLAGIGSLLDAVNMKRQRRPTISSAALLVVPSLALFVVWRAPPLVDRLAHDRWLMLLEAATLVPAGTLIWLELVRSPPMAPRLAPYYRIAVAAVTMWTLWIVGYVVGLANSDTYAVFAREHHRVIGVAADQQITAGLMWFVAAAAFVPVVFANLTSWLRSD